MHESLKRNTGAYRTPSNKVNLPRQDGICDVFFDITLILLEVFLDLIDDVSLQPRDLSLGSFVSTLFEGPFQIA